MLPEGARKGGSVLEEEKEMLLVVHNIVKEEKEANVALREYVLMVQCTISTWKNLENLEENINHCAYREIKWKSCIMIVGMINLKAECLLAKRDVQRMQTNNK